MINERVFLVPEDGTDGDFSKRVRIELEKNGCAVTPLDSVEEFFDFDEVAPFSKREPAILAVLSAVKNQEGSRIFESIRAVASAQSVRPVVVGTGFGEIDRLKLLRAGAVDIIDSLYSAREIALRLKGLTQLPAMALGGEDSEEKMSMSWRLGEDTLTIDNDAHMVSRNGLFVRVTETEWRVLSYLSARSGKNCSREVIIRECMKYDISDPYVRSLDAHIMNLRRKLGSHDWIETIRGYGYQFCGTPTPLAVPSRV